MKFSDLKCCPFCGGEEFYERRRAVGPVTYYFRFDGEEANNSEMYSCLSYSGSGRVWCAECDSYLGNYETDVVGVRAERQYYLKEIFDADKPV